ncbi:MAG: hypothetical protein E6767_10820 [Dysgonomonas sp.]|nr:hypothetical protein [Dysgonomonas sp.]
MKYTLIVITVSLIILSGCNSSTSKFEIKRGPFAKTFYYINESHADTASLKGAVKAIDYYNTEKRSIPPFNVDGHSLYLQKTITYTSDKRRLSEKSHVYKSDMLYYYDKENKLYLKRYVNEYQSEDSERFWYDGKGNPVRNLKYRLSRGKKPAFDGYEEISYTYNDDASDGVYTSLKTLAIGYDTLRLDEDDYNRASFNAKAQPIYMNKTRYSYDEKGRLETKRGSYNNEVIQFYYNGDVVSMMSEKTTYSNQLSTYDKNGNLISKMQDDGTGYQYEYQYDEKDNWIQKKSYYIGSDKSKELKEIECRKITYYVESETNMGVDESLLPVSEEIRYMVDNVVKWAEDKQVRVDAYQQDIDSGNYGERISIESATDINDFTPRLWNIIDQADGDLNGDSIPDKVVIYTTPVKYSLWDESCCLAIYKRVGNKWELWDQSFAPVLSPQAGGMAINAFSGVGIIDQCIYVRHEGLSSGVHWNFSHTYQYIDNYWCLTYTERSEGNAWFNSSYEYDFISGDFKGTSTTYDVENGGVEKDIDQSEYSFKLERLPLMDEDEPGNRTLKIPDSEKTIIY